VSINSYGIPLLILAGGFGTRLQDEVKGAPKALAPIGNNPFLYLQIENWIRQGIRSFVFLLHYKADLIINFLEKERFNLLKESRFYCVTEPIAMGTGGAVAYAIKNLKIKGEFLVINADTWLGGGIHELIDTKSPAILVVKVSDVKRYGSVNWDAGNMVISFTEKKIESKNMWINGGLCKLNDKIFQEIDKRVFSLEEDVFQKCIRHNILQAVPVGYKFIDIGVPKDYHYFCNWIKTKKSLDHEP